MSSLDDAIDAALSALGPDGPSSTFDVVAYAEGMRLSAEDKARTVVELLNDKACPVRGRRPVFVSIGGADGQELAYLLQNSPATDGVLVEGSRALCELARARDRRGKQIHVYEGDAQTILPDAMKHAVQLAAAAPNTFLAVTCHAIIHELFDRGREQFDPARFFSAIFSSEELPIWFTYREPGAPEDWPERILVRANTTSTRLLRLTLAIRERHPSFRQSSVPVPLNDGVLVPRDLGMELLVKLFHVGSLGHELAERSTAVNHRILNSMLMLAVGERATSEQRGLVSSHSAPTRTFVTAWEQCGIRVDGLTAEGALIPLGVPESQTRMIAWRLPAPTAPQTNRDARLEPGRRSFDADLALARESLASGDTGLLTALLSSRGRAWIESDSAGHSLELFQEVIRLLPDDAPSYLWSHFLLQLAGLFADLATSPEVFSREIEARAARVGLGGLFASERMEFSRKLGDLELMLATANELLPRLPAILQRDPRDAVSGYTAGVMHFLLANCLRFGGRYDAARELVLTAQRLFHSGIPSHETELAHCYYAVQVCNVMLGMPVEPLPPMSFETTMRFAGALIRLSFSHAAWVVDDIDKAQSAAESAATQFDAIGARRYSVRAKGVHALLGAWKARRSGAVPDFTALPSPIGSVVAALTGEHPDFDLIGQWLATARASHAVGVLQFAKAQRGVWDHSGGFRLPPTLELRETATLAWAPPQEARTLEECDALLRGRMNLPLDARLPLIGD